MVAAMLGAVGAHALTTTSRRLRLAAIAQLPTETFVTAVDEEEPVTDSSSSSGRGARQGRGSRSHSPAPVGSSKGSGVGVTRGRGKGVACRICLAAFKEGESLTRLPCDHLYHG